MKTQNQSMTKRSQSITRVMSFTSGKGGVGKTNTVLNTAIALSQLGKHVLVLDADLGLANVDVLLGLQPRKTLAQVLAGECGLREIMLDGPEGISIIPAASGVESMCALDQDSRIALMSAVEQVAADFDYLLIDTQAGIGPDVMYFNCASSEIVCLVSGEPTSLTDAYALIKLLSLNYGEKSVSILVNNLHTRDGSQDRSVLEREAFDVFKRLSRAVDRFLHVQLKYLGYVPSDQAVRAAVHAQKALLEVYPSSRAGLAYSALARKIDTDFIDLRVKGGIQFFFKQLMEISAYGS